MSEQEWMTICFLVEEWWPPSPAEGEFDEGRRHAWRLALDGYSAEQVVTGLKVLLARGGKWRPRVSELIAEMRKDASAPTFEEFYRLAYGAGGILRARPAPGGRYGNEAEMRAARNEAAQERANTMHPLVASFIARYGVERLRTLEVDHEVYGEANRKQLRDAWDRHVEAMDGREVAALASGRRDGLAQLDPLSVLGGPWAERARLEIGAGS